MQIYILTITEGSQNSNVDFKVDATRAVGFQADATKDQNDRKNGVKIAAAG